MGRRHLERGLRLVELVSERAVDVVVFDASSAITPVARTADALRALARPVGVVMVAEGPQPAVATTRLVAKWGPFDALAAAAERAYLHSRSAAWKWIGAGDGHALVRLAAASAGAPAPCVPDANLVVDAGPLSRRIAPCGDASSSARGRPAAIGSGGRRGRCRFP